MTEQRVDAVATHAAPMKSECFETMTIVAGRYFNPQPVTGYQMKSGPLGNPLHENLDTDFEQKLAERFSKVVGEKTTLGVKRLHMQMPQIDPSALPSSSDYQPVEAPESLATTSMSLVWLKQEDVKSARIGYHFKDNTLADLKDRLAEEIQLNGIIGNLGYFMTKELNVGDHIWSHKLRYPNPDHQLPEILSYLGFYYFADENGEVETAGFPTAHDSAVAVDLDGKVHVLPSVTCNRFDIDINNSPFHVDCLNPSLEDVAHRDVALFNVNFPMTHQGHLVEFAPMLQLENRINVFVANRGNGVKPEEEVVKIWQGECPLPSFGSLLSFKREAFDRLFPQGLQVGDRVNVKPYANEIDLSKFKQVLGGLVPSVIDGQPIVPTGNEVTAEQAEHALDRVANTDSPLARSGKETNNFDALIREPSGLFIQTDNHIGYLLFDGRHEMSIGANIVDVANLLKRVTESDIDLFEGETLHNAIAIDGGSAMKVYAATVDGVNEPKMDILNRVAAGGRNSPGDDPQGLNLYSTVILEV
ncbi:hypothetical protein [Vibrio maerlii]|uniref:hypothetical protein n=1 Tax=Vibrio maerlii TaxID=2231648 RepID=UPI001F13B1C2|nr:hypothetical protein [Vibrio maerlii]